jgi:selenocysteine lyase/cysteine desulfurase
VHYAPHGRIDVQAIGCDYLVCSGYKIFAPHMGFLWGRRDALNGLPTFREDFIPDTTPAKLEVGTYVYENVAGMDAAIAYLEGLAEVTDGRRRDRLAQAMDRIREYELELTRVLLERMSAIPGVTVHGIADPDDAGERVPTVCFTVAGMAPADVSRQLSDRGIGVRDGHMYAPRLIRRLGLSDRTGAVRASLVHYNTTEEIDRFAEDLRTIAGSR